MSTLMMKFGGSSVGTTAALTQVLSIVLHEHKRWDRLVLIASALDGVTDMLLEAAHLAQLNNQRGYRRIAATLRTRHLALVEQLPLGAQERAVLQADIDRLLFEMLDVCQTVASIPSETLSPETSDKIAAVGERLSARIIAALLRQNDVRGVAIDGTDVIITDYVHGNATPDLNLTRAKVEENLTPLLERKIIPIVTGFIGATPTSKTTTIGRGGSDYTASILGLCLRADELWIWSDVDGMMSTDPREVETARVIEELSYNEVAELAYFGARILHSRMIQPLKERDILIRIKNVYKPQLPGTLIHRIEERIPPRIKAVTLIQGIGLSAERSGSVADMARLVDETLFQSVGTHTDVMISSQSSSRSFLCFIIPTAAGLEAVDAAQIALRARLLEVPDGILWMVRPLSVITAIGEKLADKPELSAQILGCLTSVRVLGLAQGPSRCSLSIIVDPADAEAALRQVHALTLKSD
jgi:bifunctional aspartokinase / homoserine dehydrogenase 1